jgi:hypothetical protein
MSFSRIHHPKRQHREVKPNAGFPTQPNPELNQSPSRPLHRSLLAEPERRFRGTNAPPPVLAERRGLRLSGRRLPVPKSEAPRQALAGTRTQYIHT